jgi:hypothetical protein
VSRVQVDWGSWQGKQKPPRMSDLESWGRRSPRSSALGGLRKRVRPTAQNGYPSSWPRRWCCRKSGSVPPAQRAGQEARFNDFHLTGTTELLLGLAAEVAHRSAGWTMDVDPTVIVSRRLGVVPPVPAVRHPVAPRSPNPAGAEPTWSTANRLRRQGTDASWWTVLPGSGDPVRAGPVVIRLVVLSTHPVRGVLVCSRHGNRSSPCRTFRHLTRSSHLELLPGEGGRRSTTPALNALLPGGPAGCLGGLHRINGGDVDVPQSSGRESNSRPPR